MPVSKTSMLSNKIGLGTVQFGLPYGISNAGGQTTAAEVQNILKCAAENGISFLDTASAYGNAETVLGKNDLSAFNIVSKYISIAPGKSIEDQLQQSLEHLQVKNLYGYLAHRPVEILNDTAQWNTLKALQEKGLVKKIGFSLNTTEELQALLDKDFIPNLVQVPYNYLDNRFEDLMKQLKEKDCEIHTRSAFLQGLFFRDIHTLPSFFDAVKPVIQSVQQQTKNISGALLQYVISKSFIDKVIIGVETSAQLQQNLDQLSKAVELPACPTTAPGHIVQPANWPKA